MPSYHNLPNQPYKKFFGREDSIKKIRDTLVEGGTYIASIDGIGGIGKTALAYYFCKEILLEESYFNYIVWLTAKETVFDSFSREISIKKVRTNFRGVEELIDTILSLVSFEELINKPLNEKQKFVEDEILKSEKLFITIDNLETIEDEQFFSYIKNDFNKFSAINRNLKILTTSRKRKKIADFPIEIEGLSIDDGLKMLKYLASEYNIKDILKASDYENIKLIEKVGFIPLGIEFIIGQMTLGKTRGEIYNALSGYPDINNEGDEGDKKKKLSEIILFSFKDMYEALTPEQQHLFKIITSLVKNRHKSDPPISFELLLTIADMKKQNLENALETLIDNNLVVLLPNNEYTISQMAINFVKQYYEDFGKVEDEIIAKKNIIVSGGYKSPDKVELFLNTIKQLIEQNKFEDAEDKLLNALEIMADYRVYFELAKVQKILNKFIKAEDNFKIATELNPRDIKVWFEWINMEDNRGRHNIALQLIDKALEKTNNDISIALQKISILKYKKDFDKMRLDIKNFLSLYQKEERTEEYLRLLRNWKNIEYNLIKENLLRTDNFYFKAIDNLIEKEPELETKIQLANEAKRIAIKLDCREELKKYENLVNKLEKSILRNIPSMTKELNKMFNNKNYYEAKKEARKILSWFSEDDVNLEFFKNALRVLLQILSSEKDYDRVILTFEDYKSLGYSDKNCIDIYKKAQKEKDRKEKEKIISEILTNIQNIEVDLRKIIMIALNNDDNQLMELVEEHGKPEWIEQWKLVRDKSLKKDEAIIHYSDLSHLRSILSWIKNNLINQIETNISRHEAKDIIKKIVAQLEEYISQERNESFHSRLNLYNLEELNNFLVDTRRTINEIGKLKSILGSSY